MTRHICIVAPFAYPLFSDRTDIGKAGGAEIQLMLLGRALRDAGQRVSFVVRDYGNQPDSETVNGLDIIKAPFRYYGGPNWTDLPDFLALHRILRGLDPDVILIKTPRTLVFTLGLAKKFCGAKLVRIIATDSDAEKPVGKLTSRLYFSAVRLLDATVFQTAAQQERGELNLGLSGKVIPSIAHTLQPSAEERDIDVLWVGTSRSLKQPEVFLDLAESLPGLRFSMIMAPGRDVALRNRIESRAASIPNLEYLGYLPYDQVHKQFARASILVNTSRTEGYPNTFIQAWQHGTPVVTLGVDPDGAVLEHALGHVAHDFDGLKQAVEVLVQDQAQYSRLSANCREYVERVHGAPTVVGEFLDLFARLESGE